MPALVVHRLKAIKIDHVDRDFAVGHLGAQQGIVKPNIKRAAICQAGKGVAHREVMNGGFRTGERVDRSRQTRC